MSTKIDMAPWDALLDAAGCVVFQATEPIMLDGHAYWHVRSGLIERLAKCIDLLSEDDAGMKKLKDEIRKRGMQEVKS